MIRLSWNNSFQGWGGFQAGSSESQACKQAGFCTPWGEHGHRAPGGGTLSGKGCFSSQNGRVCFLTDLSFPARIAACRSTSAASRVAWLCGPIQLYKTARGPGGVRDENRCVVHSGLRRPDCAPGDKYPPGSAPKAEPELPHLVSQWDVRLTFPGTQWDAVTNRPHSLFSIAGSKSVLVAFPFFPFLKISQSNDDLSSQLEFTGS